jgi:hypothetical protein
LAWLQVARAARLRQGSGQKNTQGFEMKTPEGLLMFWAWVSLENWGGFGEDLEHREARQ